MTDKKQDTKDSSESSAEKRDTQKKPPQVPQRGRTFGATGVEKQK